jgi:hypothetical protein
MKRFLLLSYISSDFQNIITKKLKKFFQIILKNKNSYINKFKNNKILKIIFSYKFKFYVF